ncbi:PAS domain-containing protein [Campylobacter corcagiensis]|uniref:PAS domain-containing protein n=1 Tax=Campylobacter corcagiensis TaxID=1448857 RepID=A0A7M1LHU3_9BACT|nr:PAS domain-containing protein [Campylobacter corcagiensis]QKF65414.1 PAS sensor-containing signal transduction protein [Campylobacter corcagiensis]QOQ88010.1 PAS domain-containing protein [Campylobacter corcagiensis]
MTTYKPTPIDEMIQLDKERYLISSTNTKGIITSVNPYFKSISGYKANELVGSPHNIVRHPDMPRVIFKMMWDRIKSGKNMAAVVKNLAKDGRYYWVVTDFQVQTDENGNISGFTAFRRAADNDTIKTITSIYEKLLDAEQVGGMDASEHELNMILKQKGMSYSDFLEGVMKKSGLSGAFKGVFKKFFG